MSIVINKKTGLELGILTSINDIEAHQRYQLESFVSQGYYIYEKQNKMYGLIKSSKAEIIE